VTLEIFACFAPNHLASGILFFNIDKG